MSASTRAWLLLGCVLVGGLYLGPAGAVLAGAPTSAGPARAAAVLDAGARAAAGEELAAAEPDGTLVATSGR